MATTTKQTENSKNAKGTDTNGRVVRITGPVVDVEFPRGSVPDLFNALHAEVTFEALAKTLTLEVAQHLGDSLVRTISLQPTDGLVRGVEVIDTGNSTSTTGPVTRTTRPLVSLLLAVVSRSAVAVMSSPLSSLLNGCYFAAAANAFAPPTISLIS